MPADLVLLDADPLDPAGTPAEQAARLRAMPVAATWVDGRLVHGDESAFAGDSPLTSDRHGAALSLATGLDLLRQRLRRSGRW